MINPCTISWEKIDPPYYWVKYDLHVIGDYHDEQGQRYHLVRGTFLKGAMLSNAFIVGEDDLSEINYLTKDVQ